MPERMDISETEVTGKRLSDGVAGLDLGLRPSALVRAGAISEDHLLNDVRDLVRREGGLFYHTRNSRGCDPGFPDVAFWTHRRPTVLVLSELKALTGKWGPGQIDWGGVLAHVETVEYRVWTPIHLLGGEIDRAVMGP